MDNQENKYDSMMIWRCDKSGTISQGLEGDLVSFPLHWSVLAFHLVTFRKKPAGIDRNWTPCFIFQKLITPLQMAPAPNLQGIKRLENTSWAS